jgi:hypothetical protein
MKGRIKEGALCMIDMRVFKWPDFPETYRKPNFSKDMIFTLEKDDHGFNCWADGYGGSIRGRPGEYGSGSIHVKGVDNIVEEVYQHSSACLTPGGGSSDDQCICSDEHKRVEYARMGIHPAPFPQWRVVRKDPSSADPYATVQTMDDGNATMTALRQIFPTGEASAENFVMFSTGGSYGTYDKLEEVEKEVKEKGFTFDGLTFVVVQLRIVCLRYGRAYPETEDDFAFLKKLRETSSHVTSKIGQP